MKNYTIVITILFVALCLLGITGIIETRKESNLKQKEIDGLKRTNEKQRDSLERQLTATRDSLSIAFETIRQAKSETLKANEASKREIKKLKGILFVQHNDSSRNAELKKLYPSWK